MHRSESIPKPSKASTPRRKSPSKLRVRKPGLPFDESLPRYWAGGSILGTHLINGVNLLFPVGERFFVRSVRRYLDHYQDDPQRQAELRAFFGQEGKHAHAHERYFEVLRSQGYELDSFLRTYQRIFTWLESVQPDALNLAGTAAGEHFTALMAADAFADVELFDEMPEVMRDLLLWHAAEEIEHKAVAFDVFEDVDGRYSVRMAGLALGSFFLAVFWASAVIMLLRQDNVPLSEVLRELREMRADQARKGIVRGVFGAGIASYMRRGFHPWDEPAPAEALEYLQALDDAA